MSKTDLGRVVSTNFLRRLMKIVHDYLMRTSAETLHVVLKQNNNYLLLSMNNSNACSDVELLTICLFLLFPVTPSLVITIPFLQISVSLSQFY